METAPRHERIEPISFLLGTWRGEGRGIYPTIDDFSYREESRFWHDGRPFLFYEQRTWRLESGAPSHSEVGFWRPQSDGSIEIVLAHTNGIVEIQTGTIEGDRVHTRSTDLVSAPTAKTVEGLERTYSVSGNELLYIMHMAFGEHESQQHLEATLHRVSGGI